MKHARRLRLHGDSPVAFDLWCDSVRCGGAIWLGLAWLGWVWFDVVRFGLVGFTVVWFHVFFSGGSMFSFCVVPSGVVQSGAVWALARKRASKQWGDAKAKW